MRDEDEIRQARFRRLKAAYDADLNSLAILRARRYLARYPDHGYPWYLLGSALRALARYDEAEEALERAIALCPDDRRRILLCERGHLEGQRGEYERAADWYRRAIEAQPTHAAGYIFLGGILGSQGRLAEAEEVHRTAVETCYEGCLDEAFLNLGLILRARERFDEAAECFREAIRLDPGYRDARRVLRDVEGCLRLLSRRGRPSP